MVNLTEGANVTVMKTPLSASIRIEIIAIAAANILFSITASLGNILILIALRKVTSIHPPTKLLFQCLAITDLGVGLISQPLMATLMLMADNIGIKICKIIMFKTAFVFIHSFLWSIGFCINCPECGQTSRPVFGVQTRCNIEANSCSSCQRLFSPPIDCVGLEF